MKALILAAGYATRLYPLTKNYPKPLLAVAGKPIIDHIAEKVEVLGGMDEIIVVTNSKFASLFGEWAKARKGRVPVTVIDDLTSTPEQRRGAIGDLHFVIGEKGLAEDLLVIGGDNLFDAGLDEFNKFASSKIPSATIGAYDIKDKNKAGKYGVVSLDSGRVTDFQEKPERPASALVGMCLYYLPGGKLSLVGEYLQQGNKKDAIGFYIEWLRKKEDVFCFVFGGHWYDIGHHDSYKEADAYFRAAESKPGRGTTKHNV